MTQNREVCYEQTQDGLIDTRDGHCFHHVYDATGIHNTRCCCFCGKRQTETLVPDEIPEGHGKHFPNKLVNKWIDQSK